MLEWLKTILGESYTDDIDTKVSAEIGKAFVAKADFNKAKEDLKAAKATVTDYETQIKELKEGADDAEGLKGKITDLEKQIADREKADKKAIADKAMAERFTAVLGENKFINDFTQNGVMSEFKTALEDKANTGKADADIYAAIIKDREGLFVNPNPIDNIPGSGNTPPLGSTNAQLEKMSYEEYKAFRSGKKE